MDCKSEREKFSVLGYITLIMIKIVFEKIDSDNCLWKGKIP
jgi:hypothetical protein